MNVIVIMVFWSNRNRLPWYCNHPEPCSRPGNNFCVRVELLVWVNSQNCWWVNNTGILLESLESGGGSSYWWKRLRVNQPNLHEKLTQRSRTSLSIRPIHYRWVESLGWAGFLWLHRGRRKRSRNVVCKSMHQRRAPAVAFCWWWMSNLQALSGCWDCPWCIQHTWGKCISTWAKIRWGKASNSTTWGVWSHGTPWS